MKTLIIFGAFLLAAVVILAPRWRDWRDWRKCVYDDKYAILEKHMDEHAKLIRAVVQKEMEALSIWRASFTPHAFLSTVCMLTFYTVFVMMDGVVAWYKGGIIFGIIFYFLVFWAVDTIQLNIVVASDSGAGGAVSKSRPAYVWVMLGAGFLLNVYISQMGYGVINNVVSNTTSTTARANVGFKKRVENKRHRLDKLQDLHDSGKVRKASEVEIELNGLLVREPKPQSGCKSTSHRGPWSNLNCPKVDLLRVELSRAQELEALQVRVPELERRLAKMGAIVTDTDPTAGWITWAIQSMGFEAKKLTVSELMGRFIMIIMSGLFPVMIFWWSDRANESMEMDIGNIRRENDAILAKNGLVRNGKSFVKAASGDAGVTAALGDMRSALEANKLDFDADHLAKTIAVWLAENVSTPTSVQDAFSSWRKTATIDANLSQFDKAIDKVVIQPGNSLARNGGTIYQA